MLKICYMYACMYILWYVYIHSICMRVCIFFNMYTYIHVCDIYMHVTCMQVHVRACLLKTFTYTVNICASAIYVLFRMPLRRLKCMYVHVRARLCMYVLHICYCAWFRRLQCMHVHAQHSQFPEGEVYPFLYTCQAQSMNFFGRV